MDYQDYERARIHCYGLAHNIASSGSEQRILIDVLRGIESNYSNKKEIIRLMLNVFTDGLNYGTWPWVKNGINTLAKQNESSSK